MQRISVFYPNREGATFDFDYYVHRHMPLSIDLLSKHAGFQGVSVERGVGGARPNSPPVFVAICHFLFDSAQDFVAAFLPHAEQLQDDIQNYTNIEPVIQFNEVLISR
jgi:uncharacterized protein (TIGR02118 family)